MRSGKVTIRLGERNLAAYKTRTETGILLLHEGADGSRTKQGERGEGAWQEQAGAEGEQKGVEGEPERGEESGREQTRERGG